MTDARSRTPALGGRWFRTYGTAPCPVCQPDRRKGQNALTPADSGGRLLAHCKKSGCDFRDVETLAGPRPVSLFLLTVAKSGERKSSCERLLVERLRAFERAQSAAHQDAMASWKIDHALWTVARDSILGDATAKTGDKRREAKVDLHAMDPEPAAPPIPDRTVTEPTFEGLTRRFAEGLPSQGLFSDEGGQFIGGFAMSKDNRQKTLTARNKLWDGSPIQRTRRGDGSFTLFGRRLSVHLMVQPGAWRDVLADPMTADTGFLARFLIREPPSTIGRRLQHLSRADMGAIPGLEPAAAAISERVDH